MSAEPVTREQFADVFNNPDDYPTLRDVGAELGMGLEAVRSKAKRMRRAFSEGKEVPELIDRGALQRNAPIVLPEMRYTHVEKTREELIQRLQDIYQSDPEKDITRLRFREVTGWSDSSWNHIFGTFLEFKRAAGVAMSRHQHAVERQVAQHNAADHYREFNERHDYGNRYSRDRNNNRHRIIIGCSDLHDIEIDPFFLRVFIEACKMIQPDVVNYGGDIFDLPEFGKYGVDPREWDVVGRIDFTHKNIFEPVREVCPDSQIDFVEGNHEYRLLRHFADATPALRAVLADLHGLTIPKLLGLDKYEINYISKADLAAFNKADQRKEVGKSYVNYDDCVLVHHHPHARNFGMPGWNGHHHSWKVFHEKSALIGPYQWLQLGCGHRQDASYAEGEFWSMGFNICHYNPSTKSVNHEYVSVTDMACVGGVFFYREPHEMIGQYSKAA